MRGEQEAGVLCQGKGQVLELQELKLRTMESKTCLITSPSDGNSSSSLGAGMLVAGQLLSYKLQVAISCNPSQRKGIVIQRSQLRAWNCSPAELVLDGLCNISCVQ